MIVLEILAVVLIAATLIPLSQSPRWWIRLFDYPRAQIAALGIATLLVLLIFDELDPWTLTIVVMLAAAMVYQLSLIVPYTPLWAVQSLESREAPDARRIRILLANVLMDNRNADDLIRLARKLQPDLFLAVETDDWWDERLRQLDDDFPHRCHQPLPNTYGLHFFSKLELQDAVIRHLVEQDIPSVRADVRLRSGEWFEFIGVHPKPPDVNQDVAERDAELVLVGREARNSPLPSIVAGDLNDVAWSHTTRLFQRMSGLLDPRIGRGLYSTFHAKIPFGRWPLDHLFHDPVFTVVDLRRLPYVGSDHFPVLVELALEPEAADHSRVPRPEPGDHHEARRKLSLVIPKVRARAREFARRHPRLQLRRRWRERRRRRSPQ
ncbi:MAG: endonuclease/exonuclease/phosphatase family protein [Geminicoccaceae bacterium]|nr:endonuclease/exonuclease/phosphatase family protein [Geminicoccaceae bacterium]